MTTREAFKKLLEEGDFVPLGKKIGKSDSRLRQLLSDIRNKDQWPSLDLMEECLTAAGKKVLQEQIWEDW
jgi:hypothetical protein